MDGEDISSGKVNRKLGNMDSFISALLHYHLVEDHEQNIFERDFSYLICLSHHHNLDIREL